MSSNVYKRPTAEKYGEVVIVSFLIGPIRRFDSLYKHLVYVWASSQKIEGLLMPSNAKNQCV